MPGPPSEELVEMSTAAAVEAGIRPDRWAAFLTAIAPLRVHAEDMYQHSLRVGLYANGLAVDEGDDPKLALFGGCGHDVGKCAVSVDVLHATDFGERERQAVKVHPEAGFETLAPTHLFTAFVAGLHHQFQEGAYGIDLDTVAPWPLTPEARAHILVHAERVAHVDVWDAMTTRADRTGAVPTPAQAAERFTARFGDTPRTRWIVAHLL